MTESTTSAADLTFVTRKEDGTLDLWSPERPLEYSTACAFGRDYGAELHAYIQLTQDASIFGAVLRAISRAGQWGGIETGFCSVFGIALLGVDRTPRAARPKVTAAA